MKRFAHGLKDRELEELENLQKDPKFLEELNAPPSDDETITVAKNLTRSSKLSSSWFDAHNSLGSAESEKKSFKAKPTTATLHKSLKPSQEAGDVSAYPKVLANGNYA